MSSSSHSRANSHPEKSLRAALPLLTIVAACTADVVPKSDEALQEASTPPAGAAATLVLGPDTYSFERVTCDLDDRVDDDILVRATGTASDGRRMTFEVERREVGDLIHDRVTIYFGPLVDGDQWHMRASALPEGGWATTPVGGDPLEGPLVVIENSELRAEGTFTHETRDEAQQGSLRASCAGSQT